MMKGNAMGIDIASLALDELGRVILTDPDLEEFDQAIEITSAGGSNASCHGSNGPCSNGNCSGSSNTGCSNSSCDFTVNGNNCRNLGNIGS